jgi:predicted RND superfamily exporter protein
VASSKRAAARGWEILPALVIRHARPLLAVVCVSLVVSVLQLVDLEHGTLRLHIDPSIERLLAQDDPAYLFYKSARRMFGSDEAILLVVEGDDVFSKPVMNIIDRVTRRLEKVDGVVHVTSLSNALTVIGTGDGIDIESWSDARPETAAQQADFRAHILADPMYAGSLVSKQGTTTAILVALAATPGYAFLDRIDRDIRKVLAEEAPDTRIWLTGAPEVNLATTHILLNDLFHIPAIAIVVLALVLAVCFRRLKGILVPLATVLVAGLWTMATIVALGYSLNIVTVLVPSLLLIISLSYAIHVVSEFLAMEKAGPHTDERASGALRSLFLPVFFTGLTTAIGFLSLTLSPLAAISEFGVLSVIGILYAMLATLTFTPALLTQFRTARETVRDPAGRETGFDRFTALVGHFITRHRRVIFSCAGILFCVALAGMARLSVGTEYITNFSPDSEARQAYDRANARLGGANQFYIVIDTGNRDAVKEPVNLRAIRDLQEWLGRQPDIGSSLSLVDYVEVLNRAFHDNDPARLQIPETKAQVGQLLFFGSSDELEQLVDSRYRMANILVRTTAVDSTHITALVHRINQRLQQLPGHLRATVSGTPVLIDETLNEVIRGQLQSVFSALLIVYLVLVGMFLSFRVGLLALLPNIIPIVVYFGVLGFCGISLNPSNSLIAPMVLGIAIDDTVHFFARFNELMKGRTDSQQAAIETLGIVGRPVTFTSVALCLGFLALTTSALKMQEQVGLMASFSLAFAWFTDFTLTPALCSNLRIATIWDALTLDLGRRPQEAIPLFRGLSNFQARIVARMARIREVGAGTRIIELGQPGAEMYAVIDGRLQASIEGRTGTVLLDAHTRGDVFGEAGLFYATRTANVDVVEDARLLCISQHDLGILRRRYPRIAARVLHNLNEILATRLVNATERLRHKPA